MKRRTTVAGAPILRPGLVCGPYRVLTVHKPIRKGHNYTADCECVCGCGRAERVGAYKLKNFLRGYLPKRACIRKDSGWVRGRIPARKATGDFDFEL